MNNKAQFTPGPLKAVQIIIENSPCTWAVQRKSIREQWGKPSIATYIDNEADARLYAAAPAMYEALQATLAYFLRSKQTHAPEVQIIRQAIAQAEGH